MWNDRYSPAGLSLWGRASFDPVTMTAISLGSTAVGTIAGAGGALASGNAANQSAQFQAAQLRSNEGGAIASSQAQMFDTQQKTRLAISRATAAAGASGVNPGVGSPAADVGNIAKRGSYLAAMDLWRGQNTATGLENQAKGVEYSGQAALQGADLSALGTIAGGLGSMASTYGRYKYPQMYGGMR